MKILLSLLTLLFSSSAIAASPNFASYFKDKSGCFILYNLNEKKIVERYNPKRCSQRIASDSTFKIALSVMAFDQGIIKQSTVFKWDGQDKGMPQWNHDQTPQSWLHDSVVWVSQEVTPKLGLQKINFYLNKFNYGNQDFSGDPGKNNGLTHAWLHSSLKISADEQLNFLKNLLSNKLPVKPAAVSATELNMYLATSPAGWSLYGKTGSASLEPPEKSTEAHKQEGWFLGFIKKDQQNYIFVTNFSDIKMPVSPVSAGIRAREITEHILNAEGLS